MEKTFSVLLLDHGVFTDRVLSCLGACGRARAHVVSSVADSIARWSRHVRSFRFIPNVYDDEKGLESIVAEIRRVRADVLLPIDLAAMAWCARHRAVLEQVVKLPPLAGPDLLESLDNKGTLHELLGAAGLPCLPQVALSPGENPLSPAKALRFPVIVKPACGRGGANVTVVADPDALRKISLEPPYRNGPWIMQEFVAGEDRDVNLLCESGRVLASCVQHAVGPRQSLHGSHRALSLIDDPAIVAHATTLIGAVNFSGIAHLDYRRCHRTGTLYLVDFNPRFWTSLLASLGAGVNFPYLMCLCALKESLPHLRVRQGIFFTDYVPLRELACRLVGIGGTRVPFSMTSWRWQLNDPGLQAARLWRLLKTPGFPVRG